MFSGFNSQNKYESRKKKYLTMDIAGEKKNPQETEPEDELLTVHRSEQDG